MSDFNPKDMDALFREGAERHEFEYNPDAWALMEEKLDKRDNKRRILIYLLGLVILIAAVVSYSLVNNANQKEQPEFTDNALSNSNVYQDELKDQNNIGGAEIRVDVNKINTNNTKEYISSYSKESKGNIGAQNSFQSENTGNLMGHEIVSIDSQNESRELIDLSQNSTVLLDTSTNAIEITDELPSILKKDLIHVASIQTRAFQSLKSKSSLDLPPLDIEIDQTNLKSTNSLLSNRWALTLFANPEWSSVGLFKESKAGWSVGTRIGYQFADKFEVSIGVALSRKIYKGGGEAYTMDGGWYDNVEPMQMDAKCDVIEIPLGLSYYVNGFRNSGFFADLGINNYMMHSEWYGFEYDDALIRPDRYIEVNEADQNSHLVGVGRIALGYQKVLSNSTTFQVAPYLQFPLTGIGAGRVNVYSSGVQLAVKFNTE